MKNFNTCIIEAGLQDENCQTKLYHFYRLIGQECANMCGSQSDSKNIRKHFELPYDDGPTHYQGQRHQETQYNWSKYYIKGETK